MYAIWRRTLRNLINFALYEFVQNGKYPNTKTNQSCPFWKTFPERKSKKLSEKSNIKVRDII